QAEDGIRVWSVTGVQPCALPILPEPVGRLLRRAALAGPTVTAERLAGPDGSAEETLDLLDAARRYRVLDGTRHGFRFRYPLVREIGRASCRERVGGSGGAG